MASESAAAYPLPDDTVAFGFGAKKLTKPTSTGPTAINWTAMPHREYGGLTVAGLIRNSLAVSLQQRAGGLSLIEKAATESAN